MSHFVTCERGMVTKDWGYDQANNITEVDISSCYRGQLGSSLF